MTEAPFQVELIGPAPRICVEHCGEGELVVFMHGIGGNRTNWRDQLPVFGRHFQAVAWDARGYGGSDDYEGPLDFRSYADDLPRVLDHFGAERVHLVGLSMGGRIAQDFVSRYPERVATLTLCDTHRGFGQMSEAQRAEFVRLRKEPLVKGGEPKDIAEPVARTLIGPKAHPDAFRRLVESMSALHKESYIKSIEASVQIDRHIVLEDVRVPTHVVVGADDRLTTPEMARDIAASITGAELTVIPDAGHLCNIEQPEAFNRAALDFLLRQAGAARPA